MDRSWIQLNNRFCHEYQQGVKEFLAMANSIADTCNRVRCPCRDCLNCRFHPLNVVREHLFLRGMNRQYSRWIFHGEDVLQSMDEEIDENNDNQSNDDNVEPLSDEVDGDVDEMFEIIGDIHRGTFPEYASGESQGTTRGDDKFTKALGDSYQELYPGCQKFSKLSFLLKLLHIKTINGWSNKSFNMLLALLKEALPVGETLPKSHYEAKSIVRDLGLSYEIIHACKYDCVLFLKEHADKQECPICGHSRWVHETHNKRKKIPHKVLRYFPIKPRLQRLFMSKKIAPDMIWHKDNHAADDNILRHPADSLQWKKFDEDHSWFAQEPRNVRLGLASDGFNPFGNMSNAYSMWPVVLMAYNLPPWKCMKDPFLMMSLLIPGPKSPGNEIDVYLRPLIDDLNDLWTNGIDTFDASKEEIFKMHAAVLWTINDFPAYANLSGWSTKGKLACPTCNKDTSSLTLKNGRKTCYMDFRRFLPADHVWRRRTTMFNGRQEHRMKPNQMSGIDVLEQLTHIPNVTFGKDPKNKKRKHNEEELNWTKKSIFFELPYWSTLLMRHNLDVMHIEKNICDSVLGTLMNIEGKTKDTIKARLDLELMGIRKELHVRRENSKIVVPPACYTLSKNERKIFCEFIKSVRFPDGYAANISRCVSTKDCKIFGMKSHDCHVFLQRLLPVAIRGFLKKDVSTAIIQLCSFFKELCCRTLKINDLECLERNIALILCKFESIMPPAFFDIMVHLAVHLPTEAKIAGPVQYRWMYPIERFLRTLKCYVRNKARPEGSIAEAYIANECLTFCSMYLREIETRFNRDERNYDGGQEEINDHITLFSQKIRPLDSGTYELMPLAELTKAHWFVLHNCKEIESYQDEHKDLLARENKNNIEKRHQENFSRWFKNHMKVLHSQNSQATREDLCHLAGGPDKRVLRYSGAIVNGIRFHTQNREKFRKTQNSGVVVKGEHKNEEIDFYGVLKDIICLSYHGGNKVFLFKCEWYDVGNKRTGIQVDEHFTSVNFSRNWYKDDPYVFASQVEQVFYIQDTKLGGEWHVVQRVEPRNSYEVIETQIESESDPDVTIGVYQLNTSSEADQTVEHNDISMNFLNRDDMEPEYIDATIMQVAIENDDFIVDDISDDESVLGSDSAEEEILTNDTDTDTDDEI